jgi:hypothetical protein
MSKFTVYQINLTDEEYENRDLREMYLDTIMNPTPDAIQKASNLYCTVAEIDADDFEQVFEIGNIGPVESIRKFQPMHSVSVGDVIRREDGVTKFVAPFGFKSVSFGE